MKIRRVIDLSSELATVSGIASAYQQAFGHAPWNEGYKCLHCKAQYSLTHTSGQCTNCSNMTPLEEYWPKHRVIQDFNLEMNNPDSHCYIAEENDEVIGFAWGYRVTMCEDASARLHAPNLHSIVSGNAFYLDEIAVVPTHQGRKIGRSLMENIITWNYKTSLLRTLEDSPMQRLATSLGWKRIISIPKGRIIMSVER